MQHVFFLPVSPEYTDRDRQLLQYISNTRSAKVERYIHDTDKKNCLFNYLMVTYCISVYAKIDRDSIIYGYNNTNKPILVSHPNIHFNASHTKGFLCCMISDSECGIDVEHSSNAPIDILDIAFSESEKNFLNNCNDSYSNYNNTFFKMWTLKEAYTKYLGTGLYEDICKINTLSDHFNQNSMTYNYNNYVISTYNISKEKANPIIISEDILYKYYS